MWFIDPVRQEIWTEVKGERHDGGAVGIVRRKCEIVLSESRTAMHEVQLSPVDEQPIAHAPMSLTPATKAECELLVFVNSVTDLFGPDQAKFLTEVWMDALASIERMPSPASADWQLV